MPVFHEDGRVPVDKQRLNNLVHKTAKSNAEPLRCSFVTESTPGAFLSGLDMIALNTESSVNGLLYQAF